MKIVGAFLVLSCLALPTFAQHVEQPSERRILRNSDFQRQPRPDVITNSDLVPLVPEDRATESPSGVLTNKDIARPTTNSAINNATIKEQKVTRKRRVSPTDTVYKNVSSKKSVTVTESSLLVKKERLERQIVDLRSELNELETRVLQNRPEDPNAIGDPYYVDPKMRTKVKELKERLIDAEVEYQQVVDDLEQKY